MPERISPVVAIAAVCVLVFAVVGVSSLGVLSNDGDADPAEDSSPTATPEPHPLAYCVDSYGVDLDEFQESALLADARDLVEDAIRAIILNPEWERAYLGDREEFSIDVGCPNGPLAAEDAPGWPEGRPIGGLFWPIHETREPGPYRQFVFVAPPNEITRLFGSVNVRSVAQEIDCPDTSCYPLARATYLTPDEVERGSPRAVSLLEGSLGLTPERAAERQAYCVDTFNLGLDAADEAALVSDALAAVEQALIDIQQLPPPLRAGISPFVPAVEPGCPTEPVLAQISGDDWVEGVYFGPAAPHVDEESRSPYWVHLYIVSRAELAQRIVGSTQRRFTQEASCSGHVCFPLTGSVYLTPAETRDPESVRYQIEITEGVRVE